jgi:hypothetical protein
VFFLYQSDLKIYFKITFSSLISSKEQDEIIRIVWCLFSNNYELRRTTSNKFVNSEQLTTERESTCFGEEFNRACTWACVAETGRLLVVVNGSAAGYLAAINTWEEL